MVLGFVIHNVGRRNWVLFYVCTNTPLTGRIFQLFYLDDCYSNNLIRYDNSDFLEIIIALF